MPLLDFTKSVILIGRGSTPDGATWPFLKKKVGQLSRGERNWSQRKKGVDEQQVNQAGGSFHSGGSIGGGGGRRSPAQQLEVWRTSEQPLVSCLWKQFSKEVNSPWLAITEWNWLEEEETEGGGKEKWDSDW